MSEDKTTKFSWCPVCMVHTYHEKRGKRWACRGEHHQRYYQQRTDPWIQQYKKEQQEQISLAGS
jgi:hypothetical protein